MLYVQHGTARRNCQGMSRRTALRAGFLGMAGLGLADLLRMRDAGAATRKDAAVILLWLDGGPRAPGLAGRVPMSCMLLV